MEQYKVEVQFCAEGATPEEKPAETFLTCTFAAPDENEAKKIKQGIEDLTGKYNIVPELKRPYQTIMTKL